MKNRTFALLFIIALLLASQIQIGKAFQETYEWYPCRIDVISSDDWQPTSVYEVRVRATLVSEPSYYKLKANSVKVILSSENFVLESTNQEPTKELAVISDYWEKEFAFDLPSEKLSRGKNFTVSIVAIINMSSFYSYSTRPYNKVWDNYDDPMTTILYMPPLITSDTALLISGIAVTVFVVVGIIGIVVWRKRKKGKPQRSFSLLSPPT